MKYFIFGLLALCIITSCTKAPDPSIDAVAGYIVYTTGSGQRGMAGEYLKDSITIQVQGYNGLPEGLHVEFRVMTGGGEVTTPNTTFDANGKAYTFWKTGNTCNQQTVNAYIYSSTAEFLSSTSFICTAFNLNAWDTVTTQPDRDMSLLAADTVGKFTLMGAYGQLYRQSARYFDWEQIYTNSNNSITTILINSKSTAFISTWTGDILVSRDKGYSWNHSPKPFPGSQDYITFYNSNNDYLWAATVGKKLVRSKDEGTTWEDASGGINDGDGLGEILKLKDGSLLFRTSGYRLLRSTDDGLNWAVVPLTDQPNSIFLTPMGDILLYAISNGVHKILKSTDNGEHFIEIYSINAYTWYSKLNFFNYYRGTYYMLIPGKGIIKTNDLIHFEDYFNKSYLQNLFIDHNGVLITNELYNANNNNMNTVYYRKNL